MKYSALACLNTPTQRCSAYVTLVDLLQGIYFFFIFSQEFGRQPTGKPAIRCLQWGQEAQGTVSVLSEPMWISYSFIQAFCSVRINQMIRNHLLWHVISKKFQTNAY